MCLSSVGPSVLDIIDFVSSVRANTPSANNKLAPSTPPEFITTAIHFVQTQKFLNLRDIAVRSFPLTRNPLGKPFVKYVQGNIASLLLLVIDVSSDKFPTVLNSLQFGSILCTNSTYKVIILITREKVSKSQQKAR